MTANSITCPACGMVSHHPSDVDQGYCGNCHDWTSAPASARVLAIVVIYQNPLDHPGRFVVRRQWACRGGGVEIEPDPLAVVDTLELARAAVPSAQDARLARDPADDPAIVECWF